MKKFLYLRLKDQKENYISIIVENSYKFYCPIKSTFKPVKRLDSWEIIKIGQRAFTVMEIIGVKNKKLFLNLDKDKIYSFPDISTLQKVLDTKFPTSSWECENYDKTLARFFIVELKKSFLGTLATNLFGKSFYFSGSFLLNDCYVNYPVSLSSDSFQVLEK